jgi:hypothetical protein
VHYPPFECTDAFGRKVTSASVRGKAFALFAIQSLTVRPKSLTTESCTFPDGGWSVPEREKILLLDLQPGSGRSGRCFTTATELAARGAA